MPGAPAAVAAPCCAACGTTGAALKRCSGCRAAFFCSQECQLKSWAADHHKECSQLAELGKQLEEQQLPAELLKLLVAALQRPSARPGRMVQTVVQAQQAAAEAAA